MYTNISQRKLSLRIISNICLKFNFEIAMNIGIRPFHVNPAYSRPRSARTCTTQSGGGGVPGKYPHSCKVMSCHVLTRIIAHVKSEHGIFILEWVDGNVRARPS